MLNLSFNKPIVILCGKNNAGKTSILESIYLASNLKSFKPVSNNELIKKTSSSFKISLNFLKNSLKNNIYLEKSLKSSKCLYNNSRISKHDLTLAFPCYSLVFGFNNILLNDASYRRDFLDIGMFHVEPESIKAYNSFEKTLKQRNSLLKTKQYHALETWDTRLTQYNDQLSKLRTNYFTLLNKEFNNLISLMRDNTASLYEDVLSLNLRYFKGWDGNDFSKELEMSKSKDKNIGFTSKGTHRSDFTVSTMGKTVKEAGSMSTLVLACLMINLARINVFHVKHGFKPTLLIDDLFFGIDNKNLSTVVKLLVHSKGNIVLTAPNIYRDILEQISHENNDIALMDIGVKD